MPHPLRHPALTDETIWSHLPKNPRDVVHTGTAAGLYLKKAESTDPVKLARYGEYIWYIQVKTRKFEGTTHQRLGEFPDMSLSEATAAAQKILRDGTERWRASQEQKKLASKPQNPPNPAQIPAAPPAPETALPEGAEAAATAAYEEALKAAIVAEAAARAKADAKAMIAKLFGGKDD